MAYLRHYQARGDPFLSGLLGKAAGALAGLAKKALGLGGKAKAPPGGATAAEIAAAIKAALPAAGAAAIGGIAAGGTGAIVGSIIRGTGATGRRYRRMNAGNVKALRRSMRRVNSFAKLARQTIQFTHRVKMKKGRKR